MPPTSSSTPGVSTPGVEASSAPAPRGTRRARVLVTVLVVGWLAVVVTRTWVLDWYVVPSGSMEPTLRPGERILVDRLERDPRPGDVVVLDGESLGLHDDRPAVAQALGRLVGVTPGQHVVKRVLGVGGDHLRCCDASGRLVRDGTPLTEPYVAPGDTPSDVRFDVTVPAGTLWVMGDQRRHSADSRSRLGQPGGGFVPVRDVTGRVVHVVWPPGRWGRTTDLQTQTTEGDR